MKRMIRVLAMIICLCAVSPLPARGEMTPLPADLRDWMSDFQASYLAGDPVTLKPIVPVPGWYTYQGGGWTCQYPPGWSLLSGDALSFPA